MFNQILTGPQYATKLQVIKNSGLPNLRVVSDFDWTLTQAFVEGQPTYTSFGILRQPGLLSEKYRQYTQQLFQTYRPIELDNNLDDQFRNQKMNEWWTFSLQALIDEKLHQDTIKKAAQSDGFVWRSGAADFFNLIDHKQIPLAVFSSGLGNTIREYFIHQQALHESIQVIANYLEFDQSGVAYKYLTPVLHAANKNELTLKERNQSAFDLIRKNVILLGDQIGDSSMSPELPGSCILRIGFLNEEIRANLTKFQETYDVVITGDASFDFINNLVNDLSAV